MEKGGGAEPAASALLPQASLSNFWTSTKLKKIDQFANDLNNKRTARSQVVVDASGVHDRYLDGDVAGHTRPRSAILVRELRSEREKRKRRELFA